MKELTSPFGHIKQVISASFVFVYRENNSDNDYDFIIKKHCYNSHNDNNYYGLIKFYDEEIIFKPTSRYLTANELIEIADFINFLHKIPFKIEYKEQTQ